MEGRKQGICIGELIPKAGAVEDGVWTSFSPGFEVKIARLHNPKFRARLRKLQEPHKRQIRKGKLDAELADRLMMQAMAETVLLGWRGLLQDDGVTPIPYSAEQALKMFQSSYDFYLEILEMSQDQNIMAEEEKEDSIKNSQPPSSGA